MAYIQQKSFRPITRTIELASTTNTAMWTPATSARIILTDLVIATTFGTSVRVSWGSSLGAKIGDFITNGSATITPFQGAAVSLGALDLTLNVQSSNSSSNGGVFIAASGFEEGDL